MVLSRFRRRFAGLVLPASLALSGLLLGVTPALPSLSLPSAGMVARQIDTSVDGQQTLELPFVATHVALHWRGAGDAHVSLAFAISPGNFGAEVPLTLDDLPDPAPDAETDTPVIWTGGARWVRITSDQPIAQLTVVAMDMSSGPALAVSPPVADGAVGQPPIITRAQWGADESLRFDAAGHEIFPASYFPLQQFIVHHTAGRNDDPDPAATIRAIYYDHAVVRDYGDIDYNYLIDQQGRIYEGRRARSYAPGEVPTEEDVAGNLVRGTHSVGFNPGSMGIALLGNFQTQKPTAAALASLTWLLAWAAERHGLDPTATHLYVNGETGATKTLPVIAGHRDVNATACPGDDFYPMLPALRTAVAARIAAMTGPSVDHTAPTVATFGPMEPATTGAASLHFGLTFSEPVTGLTMSDFGVSGSSTGWSVSGLSGAAAAYTVTLSAAAPT
ncbi:MAG: N-acetylmuramoyl-L-alanine amidase, partial [Candidatus Limnocylindrales bacterium]